MGGDKGGSADQSGMWQAMASAEAADKMYQLGEQQFQWSQQVWNQEQPLMNQAEQAQINLSTAQAASLAQMQAETQAQWQQYEQYYAPIAQDYAQKAANWASPQAIAQARGQAMADVGEQGMAGVNAAAEQLRAYGVNPSSPRYAALYTSTQPMLGAAEAAAGTTAAQNLRMQQMALEGQAVNVGQNMAGQTGQLTQAGTGAGAAGAGAASGAGQTAISNIGSTAVGAGAASQLFNAGSNAMNTYVNAVNGYNQANAEFAQANATEMGGFGSALGSIVGLGLFKSDERDKTDIKREGTSHEGIPLYSFRYKEDPKSYPKVVGPMAQDVARLMPGRVGAIPGSPKGTLAIGFQDGGDVSMMGPSDPQMTPNQGGGQTGIPSAPIPPAQTPPGNGNETPGGGVPPYASPSMGQVTDDVPAMLTANEFVIPKDVAIWKGHEYFAKQIDAARRGQQTFAQRGDIGGEPTSAIPQQPTFVSRPQNMGTTMGAIPLAPA